MAGKTKKDASGRRLEGEEGGRRFDTGTYRSSTAALFQLVARHEAQGIGTEVRGCPNGPPGGHPHQYVYSVDRQWGEPVLTTRTPSRLPARNYDYPGTAENSFSRQGTPFEYAKHWAQIRLPSDPRSGTFDTEFVHVSSKRAGKMEKDWFFRRLRGYRLARAAVKTDEAARFEILSGRSSGH
ncbi:hypothetical protein KM043_009595 [Ampulex compressa]|nr:hypothetical protein KM043_009595 [Ampulex compressa]